MDEKRPIEILIVEDSPTQALLLNRLLKRHGYAITLARDGHEALAALDRMRPALVISDVVMPKMGGYALCRALKSNPAWSDLPVMLLTSLADPSEVLRGIKHGANSFLVKPYDEQDLIERVKSVLANQHLRQLQPADAEAGIQVFFCGEKHFLEGVPDLRNVLDLLLGAYETISRRNIELARAREEAERANRAKSDFLSGLTHEMRTPLNIILGFAQILEEDLPTDGQQSAVKQILGAGSHLLDLINDVLDIARVEAGRLAVELKPVAVGPTISEVLDLVRPLASQRGIHLAGPVATECGHQVRADAQRLKQVLLNLVSNAIKYNREAGAVTVTCEETANSEVRITVADTGPGIAPEMIERLFIPFERLDAGWTKTEGSGLGLAFSKRMMEAMGGRIEVRSVVGEGSAFSVALRIPNEQADPSIASTPARKTLLHIDDDPMVLKMIERSLARRPEIDFLAAINGGLGVDLARERKPDLILLDLQLPDATGEEVLDRLKGSATTRRIPTVIISGAIATQSQVDQLMRAGAAAVLPKPFNVAHLLRVVDDALREPIEKQVA